MTYRTRTATHMEEPLTIVCTHDMEQVTTDHGAGQRCRKCTVFHSDEWWSPAVVLADTSPATA